MIKNFKLLVEYDGTGYCGWQRQKKDPTVQGTIENALFIITKQQISLIGSGRTDAGVHALGQVANFQCDTKLSPEAFEKGLNSLLPDDIVIRSCELADMEFHARFNVKSKAYRYHILNHRRPIAVGRQYVWNIRRPLDFAAMRDAHGHFVGVHDFKAFEGSGSPRVHTVRHVTTTNISMEHDGRITFDIEANGFLRFMVRNIVGTLVYVGSGKLVPADIPDILKSRDRSRAAATAPAQGLFLVAVTY
ncbi:MAG: tRNA pseudouridine(38-40) synthase TruA [Desulfobacterales bacterium]